MNPPKILVNSRIYVVIAGLLIHYLYIAGTLCKRRDNNIPYTNNKLESSYEVNAL